MNRGDMEGLLSHYQPNCGQGGEETRRIDRFDRRRRRRSGSSRAESGDPLLLLYCCTKKRMAIIVDPQWPFLPSRGGKGATPRNAASISLLPIPPSLSMKTNGWMDGWQEKGFNYGAVTSGGRINDWN